MSTLKLFSKKNLIFTMTSALRGSIAIIPASYARDSQASPTLPYRTLHLVRKAASAALQQCRQRGIAEAIANTPMTEGSRETDRRLVILVGGLPIVIDRQRAGRICVGGAPGRHLDEACAKEKNRNHSSLLDNTCPGRGLIGTKLRKIFGCLVLIALFFRFAVIPFRRALVIFIVAIGIRM